jgi:hypothetical protein
MRQLTYSVPLKWSKVYVLAPAAAGAALVLIYLYMQESKPAHALEVDAIKDTTDIAGTQYRIRVINVGKDPLTGITVTLGTGDVQKLASLDPGDDFYFYPKPTTNTTNVQVTTNEGVTVMTDYRSPAKTFGLPGSGR